MARNSSKSSRLVKTPTGSEEDELRVDMEWLTQGIPKFSDEICVILVIPDLFALPAPTVGLRMGPNEGCKPEVTLVIYEVVWIVASTELCICWMLNSLKHHQQAPGPSNVCSLDGAVEQEVTSSTSSLRSLSKTLLVIVLSDAPQREDRRLRQSSSYFHALF